MHAVHQRLRNALRTIDLLRKDGHCTPIPPHVRTPPSRVPFSLLRLLAHHECICRLLHHHYPSHHSCVYTARKDLEQAVCGRALHELSCDHHVDCDLQHHLGSGNPTPTCAGCMEAANPHAEKGCNQPAIWNWVNVSYIYLFVTIDIIPIVIFTTLARIGLALHR
jgi:hypothetical protein